MPNFLFENANIFDGVNEELLPGHHVLVEGERIVEVSATPIRSADAVNIDCSGKTLMPGLIDAHVHVYIADLDGTLPRAPATYYAQYAGKFLSFILDCGFTTVRDIAGGDHGLAMAIRKGFLTAPRFYYGGLALSQTGGHGDMRAPSDATSLCACGAEFPYLSIIADGVDECTRRVREELRKGAHHIKIMGSGGVMSPSDPIDRCQYSDAEINAIVDECTRHGAYVAAHCHPDEAIRRCVELGVRTIEHATLISEETADIMVEREAFTVPTFAVMGALRDGGRGASRRNREKLNAVWEYALTGLEIMHTKGVKTGFGTDLLAHQHVLQGTEFTLRSEVLPAIDILRSATSVNAELLGEEHQLGRVAPGYYADLIVVNGNPLANIELLASNGEDLDLIMRNGEVIRGL
ncbi:MAG: amidohydrolase family protein [Pseudomonadales bacterium]|jgi:imidazolonepropionase-like amidohydrolase|nr:amidohydrolase family protein [Kiritimatiellia bacterium]MDP6970023.1 amidohydrolase family protein [Pseudomonadales bacterium]